MNPTQPTQIDPNQLKQAVQWSSQNSSDPRAMELQKRIQTGELNPQLKTIGLKSDWGQPAPQPVDQTPQNTIGNYLSQIMPTVGDLHSKSMQSIGQDTINNVKTLLSPKPAVSEDYGSFGKNFSADVAKRLTSGGHLLTDVAGATMSPLMNTFQALIPPEIRNDYEKGVNWVADKLTNEPHLLKLANAINDFNDKNPDVSRSVIQDLPSALFLGTAGTVSSNNPEVSMNGAKQSVGYVANDVQSGMNSLKQGENNIQTPNIQNSIDNPVSKLKNFLSEKNVNPQVETAASRMDDPLDQYNKYAQQAQANKFDATEDKPLEQVGNDAGNAFKQVVKMRQTVGKMMENELENSGVGDVETNTSSAQNNLSAELERNNLSYNPKTQSMDVMGQSKMTSADADILGQYATELQKLGPNPTVRELDAFMSRVPKEMDIYKGQNNIVGTTNAERIVQNNLDSLRGQFDPVAIGNPNLQDYYDFRKAYSDLSTKINEASGYFGKMNADGSFARDASMVKNSITSLLGGGKRTVLQNLEELTGEPLIDKAVLAAQAMKDAGDASGTSLLQTLYDNPPTSSSGLAGKILNWGIDKGKQLFLGDAADQTRTVIQSLQDGKSDMSTYNTTNTPSDVNASAGDMANNIKNTNTSISPSLPPNENNVNTEPIVNKEAGFIKNPFASDESTPATNGETPTDPRFQKIVPPLPSGAQSEINNILNTIDFKPDGMGGTIPTTKGSGNFPFKSQGGSALTGFQDAVNASWKESQTPENIQKVMSSSGDPVEMVGTALKNFGNFIVDKIGGGINTVMDGAKGKVYKALQPFISTVPQVIQKNLQTITDNIKNIAPTAEAASLVDKFNQVDPRSLVATPYMQTIVSDESNTIRDTGANAVAAWAGDPAWVVQIPGAKWIWKSEFVANPLKADSADIQKTFNLADDLDKNYFSLMKVSADNKYTFYINGQQVYDMQENFGFTPENEQTIDITKYLRKGSNTFDFKVKNLKYDWNNSGVDTNFPLDVLQKSNPAGLLYRVDIMLDDGKTPPPPNNPPPPNLPPPYVPPPYVPDPNEVNRVNKTRNMHWQEF